MKPVPVTRMKLPKFPNIATHYQPEASYFAGKQLAHNIRFCTSNPIADAKIRAFLFDPENYGMKTKIRQEDVLLAEAKSNNPIAKKLVSSFVRIRQLTRARAEVAMKKNELVQEQLASGKIVVAEQPCEDFEWEKRLEEQETAVFEIACQIAHNEQVRCELFEFAEKNFPPDFPLFNPHGFGLPYVKH